MKTNLRIGEVLMERNYITQEQMEQRSPTRRSTVKSESVRS
mgnify:CR=1 FL=1